MKNELQEKLDVLGWAEGSEARQAALFALLQEIVRCLKEPVQMAFEAEANRFAAALVRTGRAKPAHQSKWFELYLKDKDLALEAAAALEVRFDAAPTGGEPQEHGRPAEPSPLARENPEVVEVLKAMGYDEAAIERRLGELYGQL